VPRSKHLLGYEKRPLVPYKQIIAVCFEIHTEYINTPRGQNVEFPILYLVVNKITTRLGTVKVRYDAVAFSKIKVSRNRPRWPKGVPVRLRPRIFLIFGTTRVVDRQPYTPAAFTPRGNPWYSFLEAESTPGHMVPSVATKKVPSVTPTGIVPETVRLVAQWLNHYATLGPQIVATRSKFLRISAAQKFLSVFTTVILDLILGQLNPLAAKNNIY
jgi:hypothetical protein